MQVDEEAMYSMRNSLHASGRRSHIILCGTIYVQMDEEAMYSMQNNICASG